MCFFYFDFLAFFCNFWRFGFNFGGPGPATNCPKSKKNIFGTRLEDILDPRAILGSILEWFFEILDGFCRILGGFGRISNDYKHCRLQSLLWWLGRRGADQEVLIIGKVVGWSGWVPKGLPSGWGSQGPWSLIFTLFFEGVFLGFFSMLCRFWAVLGGQNGSQNRFLEGFLSMPFSSAF